MPSSANHNPAYRVAKFHSYLEEQYQKILTPGQQLSLDKTLVQAFGQIKFKVRIISKSMQYGIKVYVVTDAKTVFVLKVIFYTGKTTYNTTANQETMKTVKVVKKLVHHYKSM